MIEKKLVEILDPVIDQIVEIEKKVNAIQLTPGATGAPGEPGRDGVDADPELVAKRLADDAEFRSRLKGDPGEPGKDGEPGLPGAPGADGRDGADADVEAVAKTLATAHADVLRGLPGADGRDGADGKDAAPEAVAEVLATKHADVLRGLPGADGKDGIDGMAGIGIKRIEVGDDNYEIILDNDEAVTVPLLRGEKGETGDRGIDGLGLETKAWEQGAIYREGTYVTAEIGRFYKAVRDTNAAPGRSADWERVGNGGFAWTGLKQADRAYQNGDLYIDGGSCFIFWDGKGRIFSQRGQKGDTGPAGADGKDGMTIVAVKADGDGFHLAMNDGNVLTADVEGLDTYVDARTARKLMDILQSQDTEALKRGGPIKVFRGTWMTSESYIPGDVVIAQKSTWLCIKSNRGIFAPDSWVKIAGMGGGGGGGGGGGSGITTTTRILADGYLNMGGFGIGNLANPRNGGVGDTDAVNKLYMQQAIAAGTLFQGVYRPAGNAPDLGTKGNTGFTPPAADTSLFAPPGAPLKPTDPLRVAVWFQVPDVTFPLTLAAPKHVVITLSNGQAVEFNVPAATYADQNALVAAYLAAAKAANPLILNMVVHHDAGTVPGVGTLWMAVETLPAVYATSMLGQIGGGFPVLPPGAANTILNSYSWNIQTTDPNLPEYLPAGLPGIAAGTKVNNSDLLQYNAGLQRFEIIRGGNLTQGFADNRYWQLAHGNMAWQDQAYDKGAVVYGIRFNAWFVATQNIVPGTPEPGTTAAAAVWRKINSTYGSTIFFGKGDYDTAPGHQDAAHNYGMPVGTYPAGQQPLNGDSYYDVTSGTEVQFTVTQNAPLFVITGVTTINTTNQVGTLTNAQLDTFLPAATPMVGQYYFYDAGTAHTPLGGSFNGVAFAAGHKYYIVWSGDKDADHNGWVVVDGGTTAPAAGTTKNWSINTPHPQAVPDTITPKVVYGYRRNYSITMGATALAGASPILLKHIPATDGITHVEIRDNSVSGAVYEFEVVVSSGTATRISPVAVASHNSWIKEIQVCWTSTNDIFVKALLNADAVGKNYTIIVTTYDYDLSVVQVGSGSELSTDNASDILSGMFDYPGAALERMFKDYQTGKARPYPLKQFDVTVNAAVAGTSDFLVLFYGMPKVDGVTHVEIRRTDANGSTYEFDVLTVVSGDATLSPIAVKNQDSQFLKIVVGYADATHNFYVGVVSKAKTTSETYQVTISTFDYDLDLIKVNAGTDAISPAVAFSTVQDSFKADSAYPGRELTDILKAMSAHETASVAGMSAVLYGGSNTEGPQTIAGNAKAAFGVWGNTGPWIGTNFNSADTVQFFQEWDPFANGPVGHWGIKSNAHLFVKFSIQGWFSASNASDGYLCLYKVTAANIAAGTTERAQWEQLDYCPVPTTASTYMHIDLCGQSEPGDVLFLSQNTGSASLTLGAWFRLNVTGWKGQ